MLLTFQLLLRFLYHFRNSFLESTYKQKRKRNQQHGSSTRRPRDLFCNLSPFFTPILTSKMAAQAAVANLSPSPASKAALRCENKRILAIHKTIDKWAALCAWEDDVSTEVVLESVDITKKEKSSLIFKMGQRILRQITDTRTSGSNTTTCPSRCGMLSAVARPARVRVWARLRREGVVLLLMLGMGCSSLGRRRQERWRSIQMCGGLGGVRWRSSPVREKMRTGRRRSASLALRLAISSSRAGSGGGERMSSFGTCI
jgi:hypothetical protein